MGPATPTGWPVNSGGVFISGGSHHSVWEGGPMLNYGSRSLVIYTNYNVSYHQHSGTCHPEHLAQGSPNLCGGPQAPWMASRNNCGIMVICIMHVTSTKPGTYVGSRTYHVLSC